MLASRTPVTATYARKVRERQMKMSTTIRHAKPDGSDFERGLRAYFEYRDTGVREATGDMFTAHVLRAVPGKAAVSQWHFHDVGFQLFYVVKGWIEFEYEDVGKVRLVAGSTAFQPPGIKHREISHSDDAEILEIVSPGIFRTTAIGEPIDP